MNIKHSKFKNTGILFELLTKKITSDTISGVKSKSLPLLKKYFSNTELGKEYKLYEILSKYKNLSEGKASTVIDTILKASKSLNRTKLRKEKYNLIKELKEIYDVDELFKSNISNYKELASFYTLFEIYNTSNKVLPTQIIDNKILVLEYLTSTKEINKGKIKTDVMSEFRTYDKDLRILTYHVLLEKFNTKYSSLNSKQKEILREFIESVDNSSKLKDFYNKEILELKTSLKKEIFKVKDPTLKIKIKEISKLLQEVNSKEKITNNHLVNLLQYQNLMEELFKINNL